MAMYPKLGLWLKAMYEIMVDDYGRKSDCDGWLCIRIDLWMLCTKNRIIVGNPS